MVDFSGFHGFRSPRFVRALPDDSDAKRLKYLEEALRIMQDNEECPVSRLFAVGMVVGYLHAGGPIKPELAGAENKFLADLVKFSNLLVALAHLPLDCGDKHDPPAE